MARRATPRSKAKTSSEAKSQAPRRALWTGQLRLALVSVPVALVSATKASSHIAFHQIHAPSGKRIRYDKIVPGIGSVDTDDIKRGVEVSKGRYVLFEDEEVDDLKIDAKRIMELVQFVEHCEIDPLWFDKPYYVLPDGELAEEPYGVLRDALRATGKAGIGQFVIRGRDTIAALKPCGDGLLLETLRFSEEVQAAGKVFGHLDIGKPDKELLDLASELIRRKSRPFDPTAFKDRYNDALRALVEAKSKGRTIDVDSEEKPDRGAKVIDLVEALKRSVSSSGASEAAKPAAKTTARQRKAG
jgi:DNA end-binding protein Ku